LKKFEYEKGFLNMPSREISIRGLKGIPEIQPGDNLSAAIAASIAGERGNSTEGIEPGAIFVVAQKIVSKSENRIVRLSSVQPSPRARAWALQHKKDPRLVEIVLTQSRRIVRMDRGILIVETNHGFICANAGVDTSNAPNGCAILLPQDPDGSAQSLRIELERTLAIPVGVIISDTFGRPWRQGLMNVALGVAGLSPFIDYRGHVDSFGRSLKSTVLAVADELAAAAELVMGKTLGIPVAVIEGFRRPEGSGHGRDLIRPKDRDLFR
jgi:coenzyme F420-0:L-glutamate ligase/coenzyme F420-1:gamma-L-glutamate ligase